MVIAVQAPGPGARRALRGVRLSPCTSATFGAHAHAGRPSDALASVTSAVASAVASDVASEVPVEPDLVLLPVAVEPLGRRSADAMVVEDALPAIAAARAAGTPVVVVLDHAGPAAALWSSERPRGPAEAPEPRTGRRPRALDDGEWGALGVRYEEAARACAAAGVPCVLGVDDDGLLQAALSPSTSLSTSPSAAGAGAAGDDDARRALVLAIHRAASRGAGAPVDVALVVEELCPRGLDPTDGIAAARALVGQGVRRIYASAGTEALPALKHRAKGRTSSGALVALASAAWLPPHLDAGVEVVAVLPAAAAGARELAARQGLAGIVTEER